MSPESRPLFGDADVIVNALEFEAKEITEEITKAYGVIAKKQTEIEALKQRGQAIADALKVAKKFGRGTFDVEPEATSVVVHDGK